MLNVALLPPPASELNDFTRELRERILNSEDRSCMVRCRNDVILKVYYHPADGVDYEEDLFYANDWRFCFSANGRAHNNSSWDLIELV